MKKVWINHNYSSTRSNIIEQVSEILGKSNFDVELFGVSVYDKHLPNNYTIVDYGSRETLVVCENGRIITDEKEILEWEEKNCC